MLNELTLLLHGMDMSRSRLLETLDLIGRKAGWSRRVLLFRGRHDGPHIGWHLAHVACIEDLWAETYFRGREPTRPDLVERFFRGTRATDQVPDADELLDYLARSRVALREAAAELPSLDVECRFSDDRILPARDVLLLAATHESIHHGRIAALYFDLLEPAGRPGPEATPAGTGLKVGS